MANKPKPPRNLAEPEERLERIADRDGKRVILFAADKLSPRQYKVLPADDSEVVLVRRKDSRN